MALTVARRPGACPAAGIRHHAADALVDLGVGPVPSWASW
jgi:hypothetical protein